MLGMEEKQIDAFCYISMEDRIPAGHPIRPFKVMVNEILRYSEVKNSRLLSLVASKTSLGFPRKECCSLPFDRESANFQQADR